MANSIKGTDEIPTKLEIVGVKYEDKFKKKTFSGREYSYYSDIEDIKVGDVVEVPTRYGKSIAQVVRTNIDEKEIEKIKDYMKIIDTKLNKDEFFQEKNNLEKKIYSSWAFTENETEKMKINMKIYEELEQKYKILKVSDIDHKAPTDEELEQNDIVYSRKACYGHGEYKIYKCSDEITLDELALICDGGNLCFGYNGNKNFLSVSED
jgi:DNA gyrase/topoisomerase IV subunit A